MMSVLGRKIHAVADDSASAAEAVIDKGSAQLEEFLDDVEDLLQRLAPIKDEAARRARRRGVKAGKMATTAARSAARATDGYVRTSPWTAIGIAAIAGLAVASLVKFR